MEGWTKSISRFNPISSMLRISSSTLHSPEHHTLDILALLLVEGVFEACLLASDTHVLEHGRSLVGYSVSEREVIDSRHRFTGPRITVVNDLPGST